MSFRVVAPFCTTLTHFKPPRHLVGQPFSEKELKKIPALWVGLFDKVRIISLFNVPFPLLPAVGLGFPSLLARGASPRDRTWLPVYDILAVHPRDVFRMGHFATDPLVA